MNDSIPSVSAVVVTYNPDPNLLFQLLRSISPQVRNVVLVDNGGASDFYGDLNKISKNLVYVNLEENKGLGRALNIGFERSIELGSDFVITFDQDSTPDSQLVQRLYLSHLKLQNQGYNCAAVAPVFYDRRDSSKSFFPFYSEINGRINSFYPQNTKFDYVNVDTLITSGMLVKASVWTGGVKYEEGFFVDYTDPDWCFKARSQGLELFGCLRVHMPHTPSDDVPFRMLGFSFFKYSPLRRYYYFRNTILFCKRGYVSWAWRRRLISGLFIRFIVNGFIDDESIKSLKMMSLGIVHGILGISGKIE